MSSRLDAALAYAEKGWAVLPLYGKLPAIAKSDGGVCKVRFSVRRTKCGQYAKPAEISMKTAEIRSETEI